MPRRQPQTHTLPHMKQFDTKPALKGANELQASIQALKEELENNKRNHLETVGYKIAGAINWLPMWVKLPLAFTIGFAPLILVGLLAAGVVTIPIALAIAVPCCLLSGAAIASIAAVANLKNMYKKVLALSLQQLTAAQALVKQFSDMFDQFAKLREGFETELENLREQNDELEKSLKQLKETEQRLVRDLNQLSSINQDLSDNGDALRAEIKSLRTSIEELEGIKHELESRTVPSLNARISDMNTEQERLLKIIRVLNETTATLNAAVIDEGKREDFNKKVDAFLKDENSLAAVVSNLDELEKQLREITERNEELYQDQKETLSQLKSLKQNEACLVKAKQLLNKHRAQFKRQKSEDIPLSSEDAREQLLNLQRETAAFYKDLTEILNDSGGEIDSAKIEASNARLEKWREDMLRRKEILLRPRTAESLRHLSKFPRTMPVQPAAVSKSETRASQSMPAPLYTSAQSMPARPPTATESPSAATDSSSSSEFDSNAQDSANESVIRFSQPTRRQGYFSRAKSYFSRRRERKESKRAEKALRMSA